MRHNYRFVAQVTGASLSDVDQWLANHATGAHTTLQSQGHIAVYLNDDGDRLKLRESFDVSKMMFF